MSSRSSLGLGLGEGSNPPTVPANSAKNESLDPGLMHLKSPDLVTKDGQVPSPIPSNSAPTTGHRSRKEKLVVRSFSTENEEVMEPTIISHEEYFGSTASGKRGSRTRRTASAPATAQKTEKARSRDSSPSVRILSPSLLVLNGDATNDSVEGSKTKSKAKTTQPSQSDQAKPAPRKYRKRKSAISPSVPSDSIEGHIVVVGQQAAVRSRSSSKSPTTSPSGEKIKKKYKKSPANLLATSEKQRVNKKSVRRKLEWPSPDRPRDYQDFEDIDESEEIPSPPRGRVKYMKSILKSPKRRSSGSHSSASSSEGSPSKSKKPKVLIRRIHPSDSPKEFKVKDMTYSPINIKGAIKLKSFSKNSPDSLPIKVHSSLAPIPLPVPTSPKKLVKFRLDPLPSPTRALLPPPQPSDSILTPKPSKPPSPPLPPPPTVPTPLPKDIPSLPIPTADPSLHSSEEEQAKDLLHYSLGLESLHQILGLGDLPPYNPNPSLLLPDVYSDLLSNVVEILKVNNDSKLKTTTSLKTQNGKDLLQYAQRLITNEDKGDAVHLMVNGASDLDKQSFRPVFPVASALGQESGVSYPRLSSKEVESFKELLNPDPGNEFECWDDEQALANFFIKVMQGDLTCLKKKYEDSNELPKPKVSDGSVTKGKKVTAFAIPVEFYPDQNQEGLFLNRNQLVAFATKGKERQLTDLRTRFLRSGKQIPLCKTRLHRNSLPIPPLPPKDKESWSKQVLSLRDNKILKSKPRKRHTVQITLPPSDTSNQKSVSASVLPKAEPALLMKLRCGKVVPFFPKDNTSLLKPCVRLEMQPEVALSIKHDKPEGGGTCSFTSWNQNSPSSPSKPDEYSQRVEANLRRLEEIGQDVLYCDFDPTLHKSEAAKDPKSRSRMHPHQSRYTAGSTMSPATSGPGPDPPLQPQHPQLTSLYDPYNIKNINIPGISPFTSFTSGSPSTSLPSMSSNSPYTFKPIQSHPLSSVNRLAEAGPSFQFGQLLPEGGAKISKDSLSSLSSLSPCWSSRTTSADLFPLFPRLSQSPETFTSPFGRLTSAPTPIPSASSAMSTSTCNSTSPSPTKRRYTRQRHANICPPFDNNHCSYASHHCAYPRAPKSRFCLQHIEEGATVNFGRCNYIKGSRECGRYIPKDNIQSVFCDFHALAVSNARVRKSKPGKAFDKTPLLLKHMRFNLDRAQGKIMEPDGLGSYCVRKDLWLDERETLNNNSSGSDVEEHPVCDYAKGQRGEDDSDVDDYDWGPKPPNEYNYSVLRNAGYYSVDEVVKIHRSRLMKLRQLYHKEIETLKRKYKTGWKDYCRKLNDLRQKKIAFTTNPKYLANGGGELDETTAHLEVKTTLDTKAYMGHRRSTGSRCVLRRRALKRRQEVLDLAKGKKGPTGAEVRQPTPGQPRLEAKMEEQLRNKYRTMPPPFICVYGKPGEHKCKEKALSLSRFCRKHVTEDKNQKLFSSCQFRLGPDPEDICHTPTFSELEKFGCALHALPVPIKDPPDSQNKKCKVEEEIDKLMEDQEMDFDSEVSVSASPTDSECDSDYDVVQEMEHLVGDEMVDLDHFKEMVAQIVAKGVDVTDSEESEDTDEEEQNQPTEDGFNAPSPVK